MQERFMHLSNHDSQIDNFRN